MDSIMVFCSRWWETLMDFYQNFLLPPNSWQKQNDGTWLLGDVLHPCVLRFMPCVLCPCWWWVGCLMCLFFSQAYPGYVMFPITAIIGRFPHYPSCSADPKQTHTPFRAIGWLDVSGGYLNLISLPFLCRWLFRVWTLANCGLHVWLWHSVYNLVLA